MTRYAVVGSGVAGLMATRAIRERDARGEIDLYGDEPPIFRAALSEWLREELADDELLIRAPDARRERQRVSAVSLEHKTLTLADGSQRGWDKLLLATGARPFVPPWPGTDLDGVLTWRTRQDAARIRSADPVVVVGGGILGLEVSADLRALGAAVTLLVREASVGRPLFDGAAADLLARRVRGAGVELILGDEVERIDGRGGCVSAVFTTGGRRLECGAVLVATGVRPRSELLTDDGRHVQVDRALRTGHPDVFAAGDVAAVWDAAAGRHLPLRTWQPAFETGRVAGANMAGGDLRWDDPAPFNASLAFDLPYALLGPPGARGEVLEDPTPRGEYAYRRLVLRGDVVVGGLFLQDRRHMLAWREVMAQGIKITEWKGRVFDRGFDPHVLLARGGMDYRFF